MFSFGGGGDEQTKSAPEADAQPQNELQQLDAREQARLIQNVDSNIYVRRIGSWKFRTGLGPRDYLARTVMLLVLFLIAWGTKSTAPKGKEDKKWLIDFTLVMLVWFTAVHAIAYVPSLIFGSFSDLMGALRGRVSHAISNWRDYQYAAAIIVIIIVLYPFVIFFYLMIDGFDPYDNLTAAQKRHEEGLTGRICYIFRIILHMSMILLTVYFFVMLTVFAYVRKRTSYAGQYTWLAKLMGKMPYGAMFFQPGEYYDCGICLEGIWSGANVVRLTCGGDDQCVFHADCIRQQLVSRNAYCVNCEQPVVVQNPPPMETADATP